MRSSFGAHLSAVSLGLIVATAKAQAPTRIDGTPACPACRIELTQVAVLTPSPDAEPLGRNMQIARSSDGRWAVISAFPASNRILVFAADGKFLRQLGATGRGPGEFTHLSDLTFGAADTLYAWDAGRLMVFAPDLKFVRSEPWSFRIYYGYARPNGSFVVRAPVRDGGGLGSPVHIAVPGQGILRSYGSVDKSAAPGCDPTCDVAMNRGIAADEVTVNTYNRYSWTVWGDDGKLRGEYLVDSPWFKTWRESPGNYIAGEVPPPMRLDRIGHDTAGRFWAMGSRPRANWTRRALPVGFTAVGAIAVRFPSGDRAAIDAFMDQMLQDVENVLEVIDPKTRRVLVSQVLPGNVNLLDWPYVAQLQENADGEKQIVISRLVLIGAM